VVAPGFLTNPKVLRWLNGVIPAWTMLDFGSYTVLHQEPLPGNEAIRLEPGLTDSDLAASAVLRTARILLRRSDQEGGLKLTSTGNLSRSVVGEMIDIIEWPGFDKERAFPLNKVINEPDFLPIHFVRMLLQETKLLRPKRDKLVLTRLGKKMLAPEQQGALQALLFHITFWHVNLGYFDRNPLESWPQNDVGIVLWSLSASGNDWMCPDKLTRMCTVPVIGVVEASWDFGSFAMESRMLQPLTWFGLLESRWEGKPGLGEPRLYRKTPLFDRFIAFQVQIERSAVRH
jgi:hypothetical protein